jgi:ligand-binding sensor domain-containing protein
MVWNGFTNYRVWLFCLGLALGMWVVTPAAHALDPVQTLRQCRLDLWGAKDGLPPRTIRAITQTADGYLWLATDGGLVRFDGVSFHVFDTACSSGTIITGGCGRKPMSFAKEATVACGSGAKGMRARIVSLTSMRDFTACGTAVF